MSFYAEKKSGRFITHVSIPTTLSAAEFTPMAGFTKEGKKTGVSDPQLAPTGVILDAEHSLETPLKLWITTGFRALDHAVETLYRPYAPPFIRTLAYDAIKTLLTDLPLCQADPQDLRVRQRLQVAAWHSLFPYKQEDDAKSALGLSHALGYMLGAPYSIAHGQCSCLTLGPVVRFKATHATPEEKERLAAILPLVNEESSSDVNADVLRVADLIDSTVTKLGYGQGLLALGVPDEAALDTVCTGAGLSGTAKSDMINLLRPKL